MMLAGERKRARRPTQHVALQRANVVEQEKNEERTNERCCCFEVNVTTVNLLFRKLAFKTCEKN